MPEPTSSGYSPAHGVETYWESRGSGGTPLVVVHGGYGVTTMFGGLLGRLAEHRRVVAIELQGHGHTRDVDRPFRFESFGDDIAGVIEDLGLAQADLLGYSLGGSASLRCAIQHPDRVRRLVLASIPFRRDGWFPEILAAFDQMGSSGFEFMKETPVYQAWSAVAPDLETFPALMDKTGELLRREYDWGAEVGQLEAPTLLIYGDADSIPPSHAAEFFALLGGGQQDGGWDGSSARTVQLAVLPGRTHYDIIDAPGFAEMVDAFIT